MKKIAVCIPTYNHPDTVKDVLNQCIYDYNDYGVDIFYFDGSSDDKTKNVVDDFIRKGFPNLFYFHVEDKNGEERFNMIMSAEGSLSEYEYIWYAKDRSFCLEDSLKKIFEIAERHPDIIFFGMLAKFSCDELVYDNSVEFYRDWGWLATSMDVTIVRRETLLNKFYRNKYQNEYWRHFMLIFNELANLEKVHIVVLNSQCARLFNSNLTKSMWTGKVFKIWIDEWISANENLNEIYHVYMNKIIKMATSLPWILGGEERLMELHELGVLHPECLDGIQKYWERVSDVPFDIVRQIAEGNYNLKNCVVDENIKDLNDLTDKKYEELYSYKDVFLEYENRIIKLFECFLQVPSPDTLLVLERCLDDGDTIKQLAFMYMASLNRIKKIVKIVRMEYQYSYVLFTTGMNTFSDVSDKYQKTIYMLRRIDLGENEDFVFEGIEWLVQNQISPCVVKIMCEEELLANHIRICNTLATVYEELSQYEVAAVFSNLRIDRKEN